MGMLDVVLVTQREFVDPNMDEPQQHNIFLEHEELEKALSQENLSMSCVSWDDSNFDWASTKCALIRETWDYFHRIDEFKAWLERTKDLTELINPYDQLVWNMDKKYLQDLNKKGINIPETLFIEAGDHRRLKQLHLESGWKKSVLKPAISGDARHTYLVDESTIQSHENIYRELIDSESMLLQQFQDHVLEYGEWTFVMIGGQYSHGILKKAKKGEFRVQDNFGGSAHNHNASPEEIAFAENVMSLIEPTPIYGRVDVILDQHRRMALQELELIEPEMWFRNCPESATKLAGEVARFLKSKTIQS